MRVRALAAVGAGALAAATGGPTAAGAAEPAWVGHWMVSRDDPRLRTRAGAELLRLTVVAAADATLTVDWTAGRAICPDPLAPPCEWVGARGQHAVAMPSGDSLLVVLPVSADEADPLLLHLQHAPGAALADGVLLSARGELRYRVQAQAEAQR